MIDGIFNGFGLRTTAQRFSAFALVALLLACIAMLPQAPKAERVAYEQRLTAAERLEQTTVDACAASIRFEHPRAKPGFTRTARTLPDGSFLAVVPFTVGKLERSARCVGRADGSFEFLVQGALT